MTTKKKSRLIPPDHKRCQAEWRDGSFMSFGMPKLVRCHNRPSHIIEEKRPNERDGLCGSMSVCPECLVKALEHFGTDGIAVTAIGRKT